MPRPRPWSCPSLGCGAAYDRRTLLSKHLERTHNLVLNETQMNDLFSPQRPRAQVTPTAPSRLEARGRPVAPPYSRDNRLDTVKPRRRHARAPKPPRGRFRREQDTDDSIQEIIDARGSSPELTPYPPHRPAGFSYAAALSPDSSPERDPDPSRPVVPDVIDAASTDHALMESSEVSTSKATRDKGKGKEVVPQTKRLFPSWATRTPSPIHHAAESPSTNITPLSAISSTLDPAPWRLCHNHKTDRGGDADDELSEEDQLLDDDMESPKSSADSSPATPVQTSTFTVNSEPCEDTTLPVSPISNPPAAQGGSTPNPTEGSTALTPTRPVEMSPRQDSISNLESRPFDPSRKSDVTRRVYRALYTRPRKPAHPLGPDKDRSNHTDVPQTRSPASSSRRPGGRGPHQQIRGRKDRESQGEKRGSPSAEDEAMVEVAVDVGDSGASSEENCVLERPFGYRKKAQSKLQRGAHRRGF